MEKIKKSVFLLTFIFLNFYKIQTSDVIKESEKEIKIINDVKNRNDLNIYLQILFDEARNKFKSTKTKFDEILSKQIENLKTKATLQDLITAVNEIYVQLRDLKRDIVLSDLTNLVYYSDALALIKKLNELSQK